MLIVNTIMVINAKKLVVKMHYRKEWGSKYGREKEIKRAASGN